MARDTCTSQNSTNKVPLFKNPQEVSYSPGKCGRNHGKNNDADFGNNPKLCGGSILADDGHHHNHHEDNHHDHDISGSSIQHHDQAFVEDQWNKLSPIANETQVKIRNDTIQKASTSSTPFPQDQISNSIIKRCVKRRRRSSLSAKKIRKRKLEENLSMEQNFTVSNNCLVNNFDGDDSLIASLDETATKISFGNSTFEANLQENNIVAVSDSLSITGDLNSKLITTADEELMANDTGIDIAENESSSDNATFDANTFFGLPLKVKEILKSQRGIENVYGECAFHVIGLKLTHLPS